MRRFLTGITILIVASVALAGPGGSLRQTVDSSHRHSVMEIETLIQ